MITRSINGEGKTVIKINLDIALEHDLNKKSVLLIDADMRRGKVEEYLGLNGNHGLSDVIKEKKKLD